ncbi:MAG: acetyl-CoA carboxylase biotin carboxyl carrier protein [Bacteroidia bacterium]|jgi:acetyl-CoA carboxylase biotin carboxyl carrier protein|nr:acetyl-CoA carboxylase biotin carboxyl carrier protein [Bacteroidia bacterium]
MELKEIKELIKLVSEAEVSEVEVEKGDFKIAIKKVEEKTTIVQAPAVQAAPVQVTIPAAPAAPAAPVAPAAPSTSSNLITIKSPMIGTFYKSSSPDKPAFVNIGDEIKPGSVLCIVEAMKLFNEIESEVSGKIVKILVENASPVEYDQPLFLVEPM